MERTTHHRVAVGVFDDAAHARQAVHDLKNAGFTEDQIGVVSHDSKTGMAAGTTPAADHESKAAKGAAAGAATGAGVGALWALGIAAGMLPAIGPIVAGGILGSILLSAAGGAAVAGLAGALIGLGLPEEEAQYYESEFRGGRTVVTVRSPDRYEEATEIMERHYGYNMKRRAEISSQPTQDRAVQHTEAATKSRATPRSSAPAQCNTGMPAATTENARVALHDEEISVQKRPVEKGTVRVKKEVVTEHKKIDVPVTREEVVIERHPVEGQCASGSDIGDQEIRIPVKEEQVDVQKRTVVREEVSVGKRKVQETRNVSADVRHEKLKVENTGDVRSPDVRTSR
jgi:uncharacterized protein (TIGR02271 family)